MDTLTFLEYVEGVGGGGKQRETFNSEPDSAACGPWSPSLSLIHI